MAQTLPRDWYTLVGRKITILEEIPSVIGIYKKLWRGVFEDHSITDITRSYFSVKYRIPYIKNETDCRFVSSSRWAELPSQASYRKTSVSNFISTPQKQEHNFALCFSSIERIDNKSLYSIYGYNIGQWPVFAQMSFFTRRFRNRLLFCRSEFSKLRDVWLANPSACIKEMREIRNNSELELLEKDSYKKECREIRKLFNI
jgi:hypothetical protein